MVLAGLESERSDASRDGRFDHGYTRRMPGGGFAVTYDVRRIRSICNVERNAKRLANRRFRRAVRVELRVLGEDALLTPKLYTAWDVV